MEMSMQVSEIATFTDVLRASGRSPEIPEAADAYGRLVGSWELDCRRYAGEPVSIQGEAHFGWALDGASYPGCLDHAHPFAKRVGRGQDEEHVWDQRVWDSSIQAWRIDWRNPVHNSLRSDSTIETNTVVEVSLGRDPNQRPRRWP